MQFARLGAAVERCRYLVLAAALVLVGALSYRGGPADGDWFVFKFGARILTGTAHQVIFADRPLHLYTDVPGAQIGPPAFLISVPPAFLPRPLDRLLVVLLLSAALLLVLRLLERAAIQLGVAPSRAATCVLIGGLMATPVWSNLAVRYMHPDDVLVLVLLTYAVHELLRERGVAAAIALGTAAATKPWAVAFIALVLILPRARRSPAVLVALGAAAAWWLPFVLNDPGTIAALGRLVTPVSPSSLLGLVTNHLPIWLRGAQLATMTVIGVVLARSRYWLLAPVIVVAVRIAVDWQTWLYYGAGLIVAALLHDLLTGRRWPRLGALALLAAELPWALSQVSAPAAAILRVLLLGTLVGAGLLWERRRLASTEATETPEAPHAARDHAGGPARSGHDGSLARAG